MPFPKYGQWNTLEEINALIVTFEKLLNNL